MHGNVSRVRYAGALLLRWAFGALVWGLCCVGCFILPRALGILSTRPGTLVSRRYAMSFLSSILCTWMIRYPRFMCSYDDGSSLLNSHCLSPLSYQMTFDYAYLLLFNCYFFSFLYYIYLYNSNHLFLKITYINYVALSIIIFNKQFIYILQAVFLNEYY